MDDYDLIYAMVSKSQLFKKISFMKKHKMIDKRDKIIRPDSIGKHNRIGLWKSQNFLYNDIEEPKSTLYAKEFTDIEKANLKSDVKNFCENYLNPELSKVHVDYFNNNYTFHRGYYYTQILIDGYQEYGHNDGLWSDEAISHFNTTVKYLLKDINFEIMNDWMPFLDAKEFKLLYKKENWSKILELHPFLDIIDRTKKSGFPDYHTQSEDEILNVVREFKQWMDDPRSLVSTVYMRTQGAKFEDDDDKQRDVAFVDDSEEREDRKVKWKVRFVAGSTLPVKIAGAVITYVFKVSDPIWTPYFKDTNDVMDRVAKSMEYALTNQKDYIAFTSDISKCDQSHTKRNLEIQVDTILEQISESVKDIKKQQQFKSLIQFAIKAMKNPTVVWNLRQAQTTKDESDDDWRSMSGNPLVPLLQTLSVLAAHLSAIGVILGLETEDLDLIEVTMKEAVKDILCQIDDIYYCGLRVDLQKLADYITDQYGLKINVDKLETSDKGFITLLKVDVGEIYKDDTYDDLEFLDQVYKFITYLGGISTKTQGIFDKERGTRDDGTPLFYMDTDDLDANEMTLISVHNKYTNKEGKILYGVTKSVQQLLGILLSFTKKLPIQLLEIIEKAFRSKKVWSDLLALSKLRKHVYLKERDFGFSDHDLFLEYVEQRWS